MLSYQNMLINYFYSNLPTQNMVPACHNMDAFIFLIFEGNWIDSSYRKEINKQDCRLGKWIKQDWSFNDRLWQRTIIFNSILKSEQKFYIK